MNYYDKCPICNKEISDVDDKGMEDDRGQRWCRSHYLNVSHLWSVWANNKLQNCWTLEFNGSREECLSYLNIATEPDSCRLWEFSIRRPTHA